MKEYLKFTTEDLKNLALKPSYFFILVGFVLSMLGCAFSLFFYNTTTGFLSILSLLAFVVFAWVILTCLTSFFLKLISMYKNFLLETSSSNEVSLGTVEFYAYENPYWFLTIQALGFATLAFVASKVISMISAHTLPTNLTFLENLPSFLFLLAFWAGVVFGVIRLAQIFMKPFITIKVANKNRIG